MVFIFRHRDFVSGEDEKEGKNRATHFTIEDMMACHSEIREISHREKDH